MAKTSVTNDKEMDMLNKTEAIATVAVRNMQASAKFYEDTLGLEKVGEQGEDFTTYRSGNSVLNVYRSQFAGTNKATAMTWSVGDELESIVDELKAKGVAFEHYDMPGMTRTGDVHEGEGMKIAWFKDPDGNILNIVSM